MSAYLAKRLVTAIVTLALASVVVFAVLEVVPGDPARLMLGMNASAGQVEQLRSQMGLNDPLLLRYLHWAGGILRLDFGRSYTYSVPVIDLVRERVMVSLPLALIALALSTAIALPVGIYSASRHGRMGDALAMSAAQFGVAVPNFWFALLLVYLFAVWLRWVPAGGFPGWSAGVGPALKARYAYHVVHAEGQPPSPAARLFIDWLLEQAQDERTPIPALPDSLLGRPATHA